MTYLELAKEIFGKKGLRYFCLIALGVSAAIWVPKNFVTVPVFADAIQKMYKQMWIGDMMQKRDNLKSHAEELRVDKQKIEYKAIMESRELSPMEQQAIKNYEQSINCKQVEIDRLNLEIDNRIREEQ